MLTVSLKKNLFLYRKEKMNNLGNHEKFLARIAKSLYYVEVPLVNCTSLPVTELASEIFSEVNRFSLNRLDVEKAANLSQNACVSPCLLVLALLYLERLKTSNPKYLTKVSPSELFLISLMVGSKFLQDDGEGDELSNTDWANLTGLPVQEINQAEKQFLNAINWEVFVSQEEFWNRFYLLETNVGLRQGCKRGWFTYTELNLLLQLIDFSTIAQCFWNVTTACLLSYTASVLTLVGSALLVGQIPGLDLKSKVPAIEVVSNGWTAAIPATFLRDSCEAQNCNISSSLEFISGSNATEKNFFKFSEESTWHEKPQTLSRTNAFTLNLFDELYFHLFPGSFLPLGRVIVKSSEGHFFFFHLNKFNIWTWSDYVKNYVNKIPAGVFYSVVSF